MTAIASSTNELQFLSDDESERSASRRSHIAMGAILIIVLSSMSSALIYASNADREVGQQYAAKLTVYTEAAQRILVAREMKERQERMLQQASSAAALLETMPRSVVLAELTASLPDGVSLLSFSLDSGRRTPVTQVGSAGTAGAPVRLTAIADTDAKAAQFVDRLNRSKLLRDVKLALSDPDTTLGDNEDGGSRCTFGVEATLESSTAIAPMPEGKTRQASVGNQARS